MASRSSLSDKKKKRGNALRFCSKYSPRRNLSSVKMRTLSRRASSSPGEVICSTRHINQTPAI
eukprot:2750774-Pleurochrysis_carterae.AAC.2